MQQSIYPCHKRKMSMAAEHTLAEQKGHTMMHTYIYIHLLPNVPIKCQPSTPYGIQEIAQTSFYRSSSLQQGQRSNQGHTMMLHTCNPPPMSRSSINFLHLTFSEISPGQNFIGQGHYGKVKGQIKVTP